MESCTEGESVNFERQSVFGYNQNYEYRNDYQGYDRGNKYHCVYDYNNYPINNNIVHYLIMILSLNVVILFSIFYVNSGCCRGSKLRNKIHDSGEEFERNAINA